MFKSNIKYTNRYNDTYKWVAENETTYRFEMTGNSLEYCRYGGKEGVEGIDANDLGMFDPSGGPYVSLGMEIDGRPITRLYDSESGFCAEVK